MTEATGENKELEEMWPGNGTASGSQKMSDGHLCSFKTGYFKGVFFSLSLLASSTFLKKGVERDKQSNQCDRETPDSKIIFFPVEEPIYSSLYFPTLMFSTLA